MIKYQPHIDGLRALAVGSVLLFHAKSDLVPGGFFGVDVFFVISGYLITTIIVSELEDGRFSYLGFVERRARRILPALFVTIFFTTLCALLLLTPGYLVDYALSVASVATSVSNFYFWQTSTYFGIGAHFVPLLHTWSLSVEEQYYLVIPFYLYYGRKILNLRWTTLLTVMFAVSFAAGLILIKVNTAGAFFLPFGRFWEMGIGSLLAVSLWSRRRNSALLSQIVPAVSLIGMFAAFIFVDSDFAIPGYIALIPCLATAALIATATNGTFVGRLLSIRPVVFVGKISYSLYLWHWPALVFLRTFFGRELELPEALLALLFAFAAAYLSWRYIETPFRSKQRVPTRRVAYGAVSGVLVMLICSSVMLLSNGLPNRFDDQTLLLAQGSEDINPRREECDSPSISRVIQGNVCRLGRSSQSTFALVGDSIADALMPGVDAQAAISGVGVDVFTKAGCSPLPKAGATAASDSCMAFNLAVAKHIASTPTITDVVIIARWAAIVEGNRFGSLNDSAELSEMIKSENGINGAEIAFSGLTEMIKAYGPGKKIWIVTSVPEQRLNAPIHSTVSSMLNLRPVPGIERWLVERRQRHVNAMMDRLCAMGVTIISAMPYFCNNSHCPLLIDGRSAYFDDNHPSAYKAVQAREIFSFFDRDRKVADRAAK